MADYPIATLGLIQGSNEEWIDDIVADRTVNGSVKVRALYAGKKRKFLLRHRLNASRRASLQTFYDANRLLVVTLIWPVDSVSYSCVFARPPRLSHLSVNSDCDVELLQI